MERLPDSARKFLWGTLFGILLVPLLYLVRILVKRRGERIEIDDSEWP